MAKRGPKKGTKKSAAHKKAIALGVKRAWREGKYKNRRKRGGSTGTKRKRRSASVSSLRKRRSGLSRKYRRTRGKKNKADIKRKLIDLNQRIPRRR